ncbi:hypothetical protein NC652_036634 [Populus alba x Populus x berolinensis]|nr:hypothetical protein NC652_036632 [Populus alba x Populus x berolinensis]KAJ6871025.1 hypothetical protein NC652_036634 [Populus alba x Populus x berolinensis]
MDCITKKGLTRREGGHGNQLKETRRQAQVDPFDNLVLALIAPPPRLCPPAIIPPPTTLSVGDYSEEDAFKDNEGGSSSGNSKSPEPISLNAYSLGSTVVGECTYVKECAPTVSGVRANDTIDATIYAY